MAAREALATVGEDDDLVDDYDGDDMVHGDLADDVEPGAGSSADAHVHAHGDGGLEHEHDETRSEAATIQSAAAFESNICLVTSDYPMQVRAYRDLVQVLDFSVLLDAR